MKFRFCGDGDCPDWVLAEIISTLSNISAPKLQKLSSMVAKRIVGNFFEENNIKAIASDISEDGKSAVACVDFILVNAARYNIAEEVLMEELQQLGLPKLHACAICRVLKESEALIRKHLVEASFNVNEIIAVDCTLPDDMIDAALFEFEIKQQLVAGLPRNTSHTISVDRANITTLLYEMKEARVIMQKYNSSNEGLLTG